MNLNILYVPKCLFVTRQLAIIGLLNKHNLEDEMFVFLHKYMDKPSSIYVGKTTSKNSILHIFLKSCSTKNHDFR
jgi:hypothetical protein